ncbi:hypothetical protein D9615_007125 [Tricholomella constricta]|uniref:MARVEL domain-containing protein n=1 Tax=Tricholomella constricta TaxID=117010 RepID=A0A8H5H8B9_9AGAR|nr:hypothetical protein D9615_007125 [Tricholomella constricta]
MAFHPFRIALYALLAVFSIILIGLTASRIHHTKSLSSPDPLHAGFGYYDPIVVELLVTSIFSFLWALPLMFCIGARTEAGFIGSYLFEMVGLFILWVMYLVGAAIFSHKFHGVSFCRGFFNQCRVVTAILAWSWINWAIVFFLLIASVASLFSSRTSATSPLHGRGAAGTTAAGTGAAYGTTRNAPATTTTGAAPETRGVDSGAPVSTGAPAQSAA